MNTLGMYGDNKQQWHRNLKSDGGCVSLNHFFCSAAPCSLENPEQHTDSSPACAAQHLRIAWITSAQRLSMYLFAAMKNNIQQNKLQYSYSGKNWTHDSMLRLGHVTLQTFLNFTGLFLAWVFLGHSLTLPHNIDSHKDKWSIYL